MSVYLVLVHEQYCGDVLEAGVFLTEEEAQEVARQFPRQEAFHVEVAEVHEVAVGSLGRVVPF